MNVVCICLIVTYKGTKNISLLQLFEHFSYIELTCFYYFLLFLIEISKIFRIFAHGFRICTFSKTYCSIVTQSPPLIYEQTFIIGTATQTGAAFPYLKVVCGEPCDVWRMSAPFLSH